MYAICGQCYGCHFGVSVVFLSFKMPALDNVSMYPFHTISWFPSDVMRGRFDIYISTENFLMHSMK